MEQGGGEFTRCTAEKTIGGQRGGKSHKLKEEGRRKIALFLRLPEEVLISFGIDKGCGRDDHLRGQGGERCYI